jgi:serine/threonine protein kinase
MNTILINPALCPVCQNPLPKSAPEGLCPSCVLRRAADAPGEPDAGPAALNQLPSIERIAAAFPQLEIIELIGRGGMGFVYKARQPQLDRFVALKLLPDRLSSQPQFAERFNREGKALAKLNHPNIVSVFDFGQMGGFYFLMMEYVDGVNLRQAMRAGGFTPAEALAIVPKICEALQYAHEQGVLHRDIKPENILLDNKGRVKIADFGIAKLTGDDPASVTLTATGWTLGTPHYMAPEQYEKPSEVDNRADIYSLGVVFYEMLTGELPLGRFSPPSARTPLDQRVDEIVMRALERERELRQKNAKELKTEIEEFTSTPSKSSSARIASGGPGAQGTVVMGSPDGTSHSRKHHWTRWVKPMVSVAIAAAVIGAFLNVIQPSKTPTPWTANTGPRAVNSGPAIRFTFTAVETREDDQGRWLAIDYVDDVQGDAERILSWETTIPGFIARSRTTEFETDAKEGSPSVRHQRFEFLIPPQVDRHDLIAFRDVLARKLIAKSTLVKAGESAPLFSLPVNGGGSFDVKLQVRLKLPESPASSTNPENPQ